jgi:hypothetical protein
MTFSFSSPVSVKSIYAIESSGASEVTWTYTPIGGSNTSVTDDISDGSHVVNLNWDKVTSFTVTTSNTESWFAFDDLVVSSPDITAPEVSYTWPSNGSIGESIDGNIDISFDEAVYKNSDQSEVRNSDITQSMIEVCKGSASGGTVVPYTATISSSKEAITITPVAPLDYSSQYYVGIKSNQLSDRVGNTMLAESFTFTTEADTTPPNVNITTTHSSPTSSAFTATFTFDEDVTGFDIGDISLSNCNASSFTNTAANRAWTALITPVSDGTVTVDVNAGVCTDTAGNANDAASQLSLTYDSQKPNVTISTSETNPTDGSPFTVTFTFNEDVTGFSEGDITVGNGSASGFTNTTANRVWTADITPAASGEVTVDVNAGVCTDIAGNSNNAASRLSIICDADNPTAAITTTAGNSTNNASFPVTITFDEDVTGFSIGNISIGNGIASNFTNTTPNRVWTVDIAPGSEGIVTVNINAGVCSDTVGNGNDAATQLSIDYDTSSPTATITSSESDPTSNKPFEVTITFDEDVADFSAGDITVNSGSASNLTAVTGTREFTADISPSANGTITVNVGAGVCNDKAGNDNLAASQFSITYQNTKPNRKSSVSAAISAETTAGQAYSVNLNDIFEDANNDVLTYVLSMDVGAYAGCAGNYSYTPLASGTKLLVFRAFDGIEYSDDLYTVALTVKPAPTTAPTATPKATTRKYYHTATPTPTATPEPTAAATASPEATVTAIPTLTEALTDTVTSLPSIKIAAQVTKNGGTATITIDTGILPEGTKAVKLPSGEVVPVSYAQDGRLTLKVDESLLNGDEIELIAIGDEQVALGYYSVDISEDEEEIQRSVPIWLWVIAGIILLFWIIFISAHLMRHRQNPRNVRR